MLYPVTGMQGVVARAISKQKTLFLDFLKSANGNEAKQGEAAQKNNY